MSNVTPINNARNKIMTPGPGEHRVAFIKAEPVKMPELWSEVYLQVDPAEELLWKELLVRCKCWAADSPEKADFVIFGGGPDVNPIFYDAEKHSTTSFDSKRDEADMKLYEFCLAEGIPMVGICRGAQFINVMMGGKLYQDLDGHNVPHVMWDIKGRRQIPRISSSHHQAVMNNEKGGMEILADSRVSTFRAIDPHHREIRAEGSRYAYDIEAYFYRDICALGFQGHPEYRGFTEYSQWAMEKIGEYITANTDLELFRNGGRNRGLPQAFRDMRDEKWNKASEVAEGPSTVTTEDDAPWLDDTKQLALTVDETDNVTHH